MECDLWEATSKGVSGAQLRRWTAQIVGFYPYPNPSSVCTFQVSTRWLIYLALILLRQSVSTLFTTWASCTAISSQKTSYFLVLGTCESPTWAPHSYTTPPASFAARATPGMQCSRRVMPLQSSSAMLSARTVRGSHPVHAARATASKPTGGHSAASCT